jgi:hypothetical protein
MMKKTGAVLILTFVAIAGAAPVARAATELPIPPGYTLLARQPLAGGVSHVELASANPPERVHVAVIPAGAPVELMPALSNGAIFEDGRRLERPSDACARLHCILAVNGDFFSGEGVPLGGVVANDQLLRSPNPTHHQLMIGFDGRPLDGTLAWKARLVTTDLDSLTIDGVNTGRDTDQTILYTPAWGDSTKANRYGGELTLRFVQPAGQLRVGQTELVEITGFRDRAGDSPIPADGAVLSGHGRGERALADIWARIGSGAAAGNALLRVDTTPAVTASIGGTPILVRDGVRWFADDGSSLVRLRNPRTMVGWTRSGTILLVTVDGRDPGVSEGMTLAEAAGLMIGLGATDAINLDGGGSTSFVVGGRVANRPSDVLVLRGGKVVEAEVPAHGDRVIGQDERGVADTLLVVPRDVPATAADPLAPLRLPAPTFTPHQSFASIGLPVDAGHSWKGDLSFVLVSLAALGAVAGRWRRRDPSASA